jgi:hypothetical protein
MSKRRTRSCWPHCRPLRCRFIDLFDFFKCFSTKK